MVRFPWTRQPQFEGGRYPEDFKDLTYFVCSPFRKDLFGRTELLDNLEVY